MNKYEESLQVFKYRSFYETDKKAIQILEELVNKATKKKPKSRFNEWAYLYVYNCPICNNWLPQQTLYCPYCGQRLDWSDE